MQNETYVHIKSIEDSLHRELIREAHWERLVKFSDNHFRGQRIRQFLADLEDHTAEDPVLAAKTAKWKQWADGELARLDPMYTEPEKIFSVLEEPVPPPTDLEIIRHLY